MPLSTIPEHPDMPDMPDRLDRIVSLAASPTLRADKHKSPEHYIACHVGCFAGRSEITKAFTVVLFDPATKRHAVIEGVHARVRKSMRRYLKKHRGGRSETDAELDDILESAAEAIVLDGSFEIWRFRPVAWRWAVSWMSAKYDATGRWTDIVRRIHRRVTETSTDRGITIKHIGWDRLLALTVSVSCANCKRDAAHACMGCQGTQRYCSRTCQKADWSRHRHHCGRCPPNGPDEVCVNVRALLDLLNGDDRGDEFGRGVMDRHVGDWYKSVPQTA